MSKLSKHVSGFELLSKVQPLTGQQHWVGFYSTNTEATWQVAQIFDATPELNLLCQLEFMPKESEPDPRFESQVQRLKVDEEQCFLPSNDLDIDIKYP